MLLQQRWNGNSLHFLPLRHLNILYRVAFIFTLSDSAHVYEEVTPNVAPSGVQDAGAGASYECVQDSVIDRSFCANQSEGEYLTVGQRVNDSVRPKETFKAYQLIWTINNNDGNGIRTRGAFRVVLLYAWRRADKWPLYWFILSVFRLRLPSNLFTVPFGISIVFMVQYLIILSN